MDKPPRRLRVSRESDAGRPVIVLTSAFDPRGVDHASDGIFMHNTPDRDFLGGSRLAIPDDPLLMPSLLAQLPALVRGDTVELQDSEGPQEDAVRFQLSGDLLRVEVGGDRWMKVLACQALKGLLELEDETHPTRQEAAAAVSSFLATHPARALGSSDATRQQRAQLDADVRVRARACNDFDEWVGIYRDLQELHRLEAEERVLTEHANTLTRKGASTDAAAETPVESETKVISATFRGTPELHRSKPDRHGEIPFISLGTGQTILARYVESWFNPTVTSRGGWSRRWELVLGGEVLARQNPDGTDCNFGPPESRSALPLEAVPLGDGRFRVQYADALHHHLGSVHSNVTLTIDLARRAVIYEAHSTVTLD